LSQKFSTFEIAKISPLRSGAGDFLGSCESLDTCGPLDNSKSYEEESPMYKMAKLVIAAGVVLLLAKQVV
jgi:hypothetical protein